MIQIVKTNIKGITFYAIERSWFGIFKRYRWRHQNFWESKTDMISKDCLFEDLKDAKYEYNKIVKKNKLLFIPLYETKVEEAIHADRTDET